MTSGQLNLVAIDTSTFSRLETNGDLQGALERQEELETSFRALLGGDWASQRVLLDLHKTEYIDSCAIGWLIACQKSFKQNGGVLVMHSATARVRRLVKIMNIGSLLPIADDEAAARAVVGGVEH